MTTEFTDTIPGTSVKRGLAKDDLIVIAGAGGFIAGSLTRYFAEQGYTRIRAIDRKPLPDWYLRVPGVESISMDLSHEQNAIEAVKGAVEVYNLAADMGGMGFIENFRVECLRSILVNTHLTEASYRAGVSRYFFSSSACAYNTDLQKTPEVIALKESDAYPAMAERGYGWEKLISEMFCEEYWAERGLETHIARFHNIYGPNGTWFGGREKAPAAMCRKVLEAQDSGDMRIEIWGDGTQTRSFCYIDDCLHGIDLIMHSHELIATPINLGSSELVSINELVSIVEDIAGVKLERSYKLDAPKGVAGRNSDNTMIQQDPRLGAQHAAARRHGRDLRLDRRAVRRAQGRQARRRGLTAMTGPARGPPPGHAEAPSALRGAIGSLPYRLQMAGGWIDQPFVSSLNPEPPGSMVVVSLLPTVRYMDRCGMATGTRAAAQALWGDAFPADRTPASLVRELYAVENADLTEPSGSQDMCGLIYPGISRLDYDASVDGGWFPAHVESTSDPEVVAWLERVIHLVPVMQRPPGYGPLGVKRLDPALDRPARRQRPGLLRRDRGDGPRGRSASRSTSARGRGTRSCPRSSSTPRSRWTSGPAGRLCGRVPGGDALRLRRRVRDRRLRDAAAGLLARSRCAQ